MLLGKIAALNDFRMFIEQFEREPVDVNAIDYDSPLLFRALGNFNPKEQYEISMFLLDRGARADVCNGEKEGPLHILFSRPEPDFDLTMRLFRKLLENGADVNQCDKKNRTALHYLVIMNGTEEELMPLLEEYLAQKPKTDIKNRWGKTPLEIAEGFKRCRLAERLRAYETV